MPLYQTAVRNPGRAMRGPGPAPRWPCMTAHSWWSDTMALTPASGAAPRPQASCWGAERWQPSLLRGLLGCGTRRVLVVCAPGKLRPKSVPLCRSTLGLGIGVTEVTRAEWEHQQLQNPWWDASGASLVQKTVAVLREGPVICF